MNSKERFYSAIQYKGYDRPPTRYIGTPEINAELMKYFNVKDILSIKEKLGDDFRRVAPKYTGPTLRRFEDGTWEGLWGERYANFSFGSGAYAESVYLPFKDVEDVNELKNFRFPSPDWYDYSNIKSDCEKYKDFVICVGDAGVPDFMNGIARYRGVEQVLLDIALEEPVYLELMEQRFNFYYDMYTKVFEQGAGLIDVFCLGEDFGSQNGLLISPSTFDKLFAKKLKALIDLGHYYGATTMMHCCGSCRDLIERFIDIGLDILDVVQVDAAKMDINELHRDFYGRICFCGSISVQSTLPFRSKEEVVKEVELRKDLFSKGGMIIGPTHHIQAGTPLENILAMYKSIGSI